MEIFNNRSIMNSEFVKNEFRNHTLSSNQSIKQLLHEITETTITLMSSDEGIDLTGLRKIIRDNFNINENEREFFHTKVHDLYSQYISIGKNEVRKKLGLRFAVYQGGLRDDSRHFCIERNGKCFSEFEIEQWRYLDFQGKPENYNPIYDCGGIDCVHRLDWISDQLAKRLRPDLF
jgi:hypothetical protein